MMASGEFHLLTVQYVTQLAGFPSHRLFSFDIQICSDSAQLHNPKSFRQCTVRCYIMKHLFYRLPPLPLSPVPYP